MSSRISGYDQELLGFLKGCQCQSAGNRGESVEKVIQCIAALQILEQNLDWYSPDLWWSCASNLIVAQAGEQSARDR